VAESELTTSQMRLYANAAKCRVLFNFIVFTPYKQKNFYRFYFISYKMSENTTNLIEDSNRAELNAYLNFKKRAFEEGNLRNYFMENLFKSTQFFNQFFFTDSY
jgi:hypothetical protein